MPDLIKANNCKSIEEIRQQIDLIDQRLIQLFAQRYEYVQAVVKFKKKTKDSIIAADRKEFVIRQRSEWAESFGLDRETYAKLFEMLVEHNISKEMEFIEKVKQ